MRRKKPVPSPPPTSASILWGARIDGSPYGLSDAPWNQTTWNTFEAHTGKGVSLINWGQPFGQLDLNALKLAGDRGAVSMVDIGDSTTLAEVAGGTKDEAIDAFAAKCKTWGKALLLRPWWEMNGGWFAWGRNSAYIPAWQRFVTRVRAIAPNVSFVWCVNTIWEPAADPEPWFPGAAYVDWVGIDGYNRGTNPNQPEKWKSPFEVFKPTYDRLLQLAPSKPIIICETASTEYGGNKASWIQNLLTTALRERFPLIRAFSWFNWDHPKGTGKMDWPIESSTTAQSAFRVNIGADYFLGPTPVPASKLPIP